MSLDTRLHTLWCGPMKVIDHKQGACTLLDLTTNKEKRHHSTQMKPFLFNALRTYPTDVSRKDYLEFFIETLVISNDYQPYNSKSNGLVMMKHTIHGNHGPIEEKWKSSINTLL
jgi:hypothetical protein